MRDLRARVVQIRFSFTLCILYNNHKGGEAFNFSNEIQLTVLELVERVLSLLNVDLKPDIQNEANNEILHQYLSAEKARQVLDWEPEFDLGSGLLRTIDWYKEFLSRV